MPIYFTGAGISVGLVEIFDHRVWELLPVAAVPMYCALRIYSDYVDRLDAEHRSREVIESLDQGMCVVDASGRLTLWNDTLERIVGVRRERAMRDTLVGAMPALGNTELPRVLADALKDRNPRTFPHLRLSPSRARFFKSRCCLCRTAWRCSGRTSPSEHARNRHSSAQKSDSRSLPMAQTTVGGSGTCARRSSTVRRGGAKSSASPGLRRLRVQMYGSTACILTTRPR